MDQIRLRRQLLVSVFGLALFFLMSVLVGAEEKDGSNFPIHKKHKDNDSIPTLSQPPKVVIGEMFYFEDGKYLISKRQKIKELNILGNCSPSENCMAVQRAHLKDIGGKRETEATNPATLNCNRVGGKIVIATDHQMNQYDYCKFNDGSLIDSFDLN